MAGRHVNVFGEMKTAENGRGKISVGVGPQMVCVSSWGVNTLCSAAWKPPLRFARGLATASV